MPMQIHFFFCACISLIKTHRRLKGTTIIIIIMYTYHALIYALSAHMIHINLNMIFYTHVEHSPTKTIYIKYYKSTYVLVHKECRVRI